MFDTIYQQLKHAYNAACYAEAVAEAWYMLLWQAVQDMDYELNTPYNGRMLVSIFEAKATVYRNRRVEQYDLGLIRREFSVTIEDEDEDTDVLEAYHAAYTAEKEAWSLYHATYEQAVLVIIREWQAYCDWCLGNGHSLPVRHNTPIMELQPSRIRTLEVKVVK